MHIGNVAVRNVKFSKLVPKNLVAPGINQLPPRCIYVINRTALRGFNDSSSAALRRNGSRPAGHRLQQQACRHKRQRPTAGPGQRMGGQAFHDRAHIILAAVPCDFRHNHVALSNIAPDNLVNLIHKYPSNHIRMSPTG